MGWGWWGSWYINTTYVSNWTLTAWSWTTPWDSTNTYRWTWGNAGTVAWNWADGKVVIVYKTDWSDWVLNTSTWWTITTSGDYTIHTFTSDWTFTAKVVEQFGTANEASRVRYRDIGFSAIDNVVSAVPTPA
jgi:hypothetical protein